MLSHSLLKLPPSPPFFGVPSRQNFPPCLRATSEMFRRYREAHNSLNAALLRGRAPPPQSITASCNVKSGRKGGRGRKVLVWGWHDVTTRGNMLVERHCNKWDSALRNKNKKTHHNSCRAQRKPEGEAREEEGGKKWKPSGNLSCLPRFQPRPLSPHPRNQECEWGGGGGGTRVIPEEGSTIWDALPTLHSQFIR